jgi:tetratricopeptide (TPR) repeat protein
MASSVPTVRQVAWISLIPQLLLGGIIIFVCSLLKFEDPFFYGALTYLALSFALRTLVPRHHNQAMKLVKQRNFTNAIPLFEKSVNFFTNNNWIDKYRFLTLLSSSKMTYKEMGLCNIAFCYSQINNGLKAREYYERTIKEFPDNGLANAGLNMITSFEQTKEVGN